MPAPQWNPSHLCALGSARCWRSPELVRARFTKLERRGSMNRRNAGKALAICLLAAAVARADDSTNGDLHGKPDSHRVVLTHDVLTATALPTFNTDGTINTWTIRGTTIDTF